MPLAIPSIINEKLLQFIWRFQYFNKQQLTTVDGEPLQIIHPGLFNTNQGPDFLEAKIKIGNTTLAGNIELHILSSDWDLHKHSADDNYSNIVLHVVWINDVVIKDAASATLPALELHSIVPKLMLQQYVYLMNAQGFVPCEDQLPVLNEIAWSSWKERLIAERLQRKSTIIFTYLQQCNNHWEEVFWWLLARNFGIKTNAEIFENIARSISVNILAKHKNQIHQLEALLLGQAALLNNDFEEDYPQLLQKEYRFLKKKYQLNTYNAQPAFLRMRPANFPTIRLAQLAVLVHQSSHLFSKIKELATVDEVKNLLNITANDYWHYHYRFDEAGVYQPKNLGAQMIYNILINTVVPVLFCYGVYSKEQLYKDKAIEWLMLIAPEQNNITKAWKQKGVLNNNALHSQALLELKKNYCDERLCLNCAVGNKLLKGENIC